jgi:predicted Zn-dependent protease
MVKGLYTDEASAIRANCDLHLNGNVLSLFLDSAERKQLIWNITRFHSCVFDGNILHASYGINGREKLECRGAIAAAIYTAWHDRQPEPVITPATKHTWQFIVLCAVIAVTVCFTIWFYILPWVGEKAAALVPVDMEVSLGNNLAGAFDEQTEKDSADIYMQQFTNALALDDTYPIKVHIIRSEEINAFALPGGRIFVYSGILEKMDSPEQLVALLGHEVSHVLGRHSLKSICRSLATSLVLSSMLGDAGGIGSNILAQADKFKELDYSRELETEADMHGLEIMDENRIDPRGMVRLLEILDRESVEMPTLMKYLSTHPETKERIMEARTNPISSHWYPPNQKLGEIFKALQKVVSDDEDQ